MKLTQWFLLLSGQQRIWMFGTLVIMLAIIALGMLAEPENKTKAPVNITVDMSIQQIAHKIGVTPKSLAREFKLPINISKRKPLYSFGVTNKELHLIAQHLLSHHDATKKYFVYVALVLWGLVFLVKLGRPSESRIKDRKKWYPRTPYLITLLLGVIFAGFMLGKSPNPMEGIVKVLKSMVGLYPDPFVKVLSLIFFLVMAIVGNKLICGWACPFGALQELIYSLHIRKKIKKKKLPFLLTNTIRVSLLLIMLLFLFGSLGGRKGAVVYHYINPFNLFDWDFQTISITLTIVIVLAGSFIIYRPFCQLVCPFGLISWITERFSIFRVVIDKKKCTQGGTCIKVCPLESAKGLVYGNKLPQDCFSCARCLTVCPQDAIHYKYTFPAALGRL
jgi:ferredoxin